MNQATLFNLDNPPMKITPIVQAFYDEIDFFRALYSHVPGKIAAELYTCSYCGKTYRCISYHLLRACTGQWEASAPVVQSIPGTQVQSGSPGGLVLSSSPESSPPTQYESLRPVGISTPEVQRPEPSENMPGTWAVLPPAPEFKQEKKERPPHFWHWTRPSTDGSKTQEPYTPPMAVRRYSIPAIACSLYGAVRCAMLSMQGISTCKNPKYYAFNRTCYETDKKRVERYIKLLVFCGLDEERVRWWAREAWMVFSEGLYHPWRNTKEKKGAARGLLALLGYQLGDDEPDGYGDIKNTKPAAFAEFLKQEGSKEQ